MREYILTVDYCRYGESFESLHRTVVFSNGRLYVEPLYFLKVAQQIVLRLKQRLIIEVLYQVKNWDKHQGIHQGIRLGILAK